VNQLLQLGILGAGEVTSLLSKLDAAAAQTSDGRTRPALQQLGAFKREVQAMLNAGRISDTDAGRLIAAADEQIADLP
jgi:hypothetical protein